jgi:hypothetical protein
VLKTIQDRLERQLRVEQEKLASGKVATFDRSSFIDAVRGIAREEGLGDGTGTITDITSIPRLGMVYDMQIAQSGGFAQWKLDQEEGALLLYPAAEFARVEDREEPRIDWPERWARACLSAGDGGALRVLQETGRMVALRSSRVWVRLSRFGTPWPPYDFGSGMGQEDVTRDEAVELGLMQPNEAVPPGVEDFNADLEASVRGLGPELQELLREGFGDQVVIEEGTARWVGGGEAAPPPPEDPAPATKVAPKKEEPSKSTPTRVLQDRLKGAGLDQRLVKEVESYPENVREIAARANYSKVRPGRDENKGGAYYDRGERVVVVSGDVNDWSGRPTVLNHEVGHHIHYELGLVTEAGPNEEFRQAMEADWVEQRARAKRVHGDNWTGVWGRDGDLAEEIYRDYGLDTFKATTDERHIMGRVADTIGGLSKGRYGFGHRTAYYKHKGAHEVAAHCFSALMEGDELFQKRFPNVIAVVKSALKL